MPNTPANQSTATTVPPHDVAALLQENADLKRQLAWFKQQMFGRKSEARPVEANPHQLPLEGLAGDPVAPLPEIETETIAYQRGKAKKQRSADCVTDSGLRFGADVPVRTIVVPAPELTGPNADQYDVVDIRKTYRLAQRPASYEVLCYERPVLKHRTTTKLVTTSAPANVLDNSLADVSFLAGLLIDKFLYHLPLYRQHQRIQQAGITLSRSTLTNLVKRAIDLLRPIVDAQTDNVLRSRVLAMDETPIKAGHQGRAGPQKGKMKTGWFWPLYGDDDEVVFTYSNSRGRLHIEQVLNDQFSGTLISDGYAAYARYAAAQKGITHAQCWVHSRRCFVEAQKDHPEKATEALQQIAKLYQIEDTIKEKELTGEKKRQYRLDHAKPVVSGFFQWCRDQLGQGGLLPSEPLTKALNYVLGRETSLTVFLEDPDVQPDTNHLERALRPIPMGKKNWMFCWTELGAEHLGIIQSLISTCKLHDITPYTYLVDVLQRISQHPASDVSDLTPRLWKTRFAENPLRALIDPRHPDRQSKQPEATVHAH